MRIDAVTVLMQRYSDGRRFSVRAKVSARGSHALGGWRAEVRVFDQNDFLVEHSPGSRLIPRRDEGVADLLLEWSVLHLLEPAHLEIRFQPDVAWEGPEPDGLSPSVKHPPATPRTLSQIQSRPEAMIGTKCALYVRVVQYDAATGDRVLLAEAAAAYGRKSYDYDRLCALTVTDPVRLEGVTAGDVLHIHAAVHGRYEYDKVGGGIGSVPLYKVRRCKVVDFID